MDAGAGACSAGGTRPHYWQCVREQTGALVDVQTYCGRSNPTTESCTPPVDNTCRAGSTITYQSNGRYCAGGSLIGDGSYEYTSATYPGNGGRARESVYGIYSQQQCVAAGGNCFQSYEEQHSEYGSWETFNGTYRCFRNATGTSGTSEYRNDNGYSSTYEGADLYSCRN